MANLYPISVKHFHDVEFYRNRLKNNGEEHTEHFKLVNELFETIQNRSSYNHALVTGPQIALFKEITAWASTERSSLNNDSNVNNDDFER